MPKLVEYESPLAERGLTISDKGINAEEQAASAGISAGRAEAADLRQSGAALGSAIGTAGGAVAQAYQQMVVQPEISRAAKDASSLQFKLTDLWNQTLKTADPNDTTVAQKFRENVLEPTLNEFTSQYDTTADGRKFAESEANRFRAHMLDKQTVDMSNQAANALTVNLDKTANNLTNMVRADPTSFDHAAATMESSVNSLVDSSTFLSGDAANKIKTTILQKAKSELAKAAILGTAERSPQDAQALLESGKFKDYVDGNEMSGMIKSFQRLQRADVAFQQSQKDRAEKQLSHDAREEYEKTIFTDPNSDVSLQKIWTDPRLQVADREHLTAVIRGIQKPEAIARVNQRNVSDLYSRIISNDPAVKLTSTAAIDAAFSKGEITQGGYNFLQKAYTDARTPDGERFTPALSEFFHRYQTAITKSNPLMGKIDVSGDQQMYGFQMMVHDTLAKARAKGENPWDYLQPGNPKFLGRPEILQQFQKPLNQSIQDAAGRITGASKNLTAPGNSIISITPGPVEDPTKPHPPNSAAPASHPDAEQAPNGKWYVKRGGSYFEVVR